MLAALRDRREGAFTGNGKDDQRAKQLIKTELLRLEVHKSHLELLTCGKGESPSVKITVPLVRTPAKRQREVIPASLSNDSRPIRSETRARVVEGIAKARVWLDELVTGRVGSTADIAEREGYTERSVRMSLSLAFLSPNLVRSAVNGSLLNNKGVAELIDGSPLWTKQMDRLDKETMET